jgi:DNA-binding response OmpR family regulator
MMPEPNVLVIDDEPTVCDSCVRILSEKGYRVRTALTGDEGLSQIEKEPFDIVLVDLRMPGTDGVGVLRRW